MQQTLNTATTHNANNTALVNHKWGSTQSSALTTDTHSCSLNNNRQKTVMQKTLLFHGNARFSVNEEGVFYVQDEESTWICAKLEINALVRDSASENWGRLLEFHDADGHLHRWAMPMQMVKGHAEELCGELLRLGLQIAPGAKAHKLLLEYITTAHTKQRACCFNRTGWHQQVFVLPEQTFGRNKGHGHNEQVIYQAEHFTKDYEQSGSLTEWQTHVAQLCIGNSRLLLAVSTAFAAMLLQPAGAESGGVHLVGESSTGKTTALQVAASVYGAPDYVSRWRATANGLEALAALRSDTLLVLDELSQVDPKEAGEMAYLLANGMGKARAVKTGVARLRQAWRLLFLSAGEINLAQHLATAGKTVKAGQEVRLVDVPADAGAGLGIFESLHHFPTAAAFSHALREGASQYYGVAAIAFLQQLTSPENFALLPLYLKNHHEIFLEENLPDNAGGQVQRVCERFALIAAAGELATNYDVTGWSKNAAWDAAKRCFQDWLQQRGNVDNQEQAHILAQVRHFFELHGESRFTDWHMASARTVNRAGFKKVEGHQTYFYVLTGTFRHEICAGCNMQQVSRLLLQKHWLVPSANGDAYRRENLPQLGRCRCYVFSPVMWEDEHT